MACWSRESEVIPAATGRRTRDPSLLTKGSEDPVGLLVGKETRLAIRSNTLRAQDASRRVSTLHRSANDDSLMPIHLGRAGLTLMTS